MVVVGNITVGGAGKTPLIIALAELLRNRGYNIGIVTRGYGGQVDDVPVMVTKESQATLVGDESVLLARRTNVPVVVCANRVQAVKQLTASASVDCVLCDDGLQHYALQRDLEIAVVDASYRFGNGFCLPAGPLRESIARLNSVDMTVYSGHARKQTKKQTKKRTKEQTGGQAGYSLTGDTLVNLADGAIQKSILELSGATVHAIAGIASPDNFYNDLHNHGIETIDHSFGDHASFELSDITFDDDLPVLMTEKDAVKCSVLVGNDEAEKRLTNVWYLPVSAVLDDSIAAGFLHHLNRVFAQRKSNAD